MKDLTGKELKIGQTVVYAIGGYYKSAKLVISKIIDFDRQFVLIQDENFRTIRKCPSSIAVVKEN